MAISENKLKTKENLTKEEVYTIIKEYVTESVELSRRKQRDETNFTLPAWPEFQAYHLGMQKAYQKLLDFLP